MEYEQNQDLESQIAQIQSSFHALEDGLKQCQEKEVEAKLEMESITAEINQMKDELQGVFLFLRILTLYTIEITLINLNIFKVLSFSCSNLLIFFLSRGEKEIGLFPRVFLSHLGSLQC